MDGRAVHVDLCLVCLSGSETLSCEGLEVGI